MPALNAFAFALFVLIALACLCLPSYPLIFPEGKEPRLIGPDAYYHLRHTKTVLAHYPVVARKDFMIGFPHGEVGLNQGFFDVTLATIVKLGGGWIRPLDAMAWVSPLCYIAAVGIGFHWFLRRGNQRSGLLFLLFCALYPGPLKAIAALGHGDHHAFEVLLAVTIAASLDACLRPNCHWKWTALAVLPLFYLYLSWAGTPLHLLLVGAVFYVRAWRPPLEGEALAHKGVVYGLTLLILTEASARIWPWTQIWGVSHRLFQIGALALAVGYPLLVWLARKPWKNPVLVGIGTVLGSLGLLALTPAGYSALSSLVEERTRQVAEHTPASLPLMLHWFGFLWVVALATPWLIWKRKALWESLVPFLFGGGLILFWVKTYDFNYYTPIAIAAGAAYVLGTVEWKKPILLSLAFLAIMPLVPSVMEQPWTNRRYLREIVLYSDGMESASKWLKSVQGPPAPPGQRQYGMICPWDLGNILSETADTPVGHAETTSQSLAKFMYSEDPDAEFEKMTVDGKPFRYVFLPARNLAEKFLGEMAAAGLTVSDMYTPGPKVEWRGGQTTLLSPTNRNKRSLINRLYWDKAENLGHFRLVYESPEQAVHVQRLRPDRRIEFYAWPATPEIVRTTLKPLLDNPEKVLQTSRGALVGARTAPEIRIFEAVRGAVVEGKARPQARIQAALALYSPTTKRSWTTMWFAKADDSGHFALRLPYSTDRPLSSDPNTIQVRGPYKVKVGGELQLVPVSEDDVQEGRTIPFH